MIEQYFNSSYIFENHTNINNKVALIDQFYKRSGTSIKTFDSKKSIYAWIYKHTYNKEVFWFEKCNEKRGYFKLKKEVLKRLEDERINNDIQ